MLCEFGECNKVAVFKSGGLCRGHMSQKQRNIELRPLRVVDPDKPKVTRKICTFPDCGRRLVTDGLCHIHLKQKQRGEDLAPIADKSPVCLVANCGVKKQAMNLCANHYKISKLYSMSTEQVIDLFSDPQCQICGRTERRLTVDHDHNCCSGYKSCGKCVRGTLCFPCNTTLGHFNDDPAEIRKMLNYLESNMTHA